MALARAHIKPLADGEKVHLTDIIGYGRGRTFWVMAAATTNYAQFFADHNVVDSTDKTNSVYNTIQAAISACVSGRGDVIYVTEGYTETVTATSIAHSVAGVSIIGLGNKDQRPTFTFGAAAATITVSAANGSWRNCRFVANFLNVASAFTLTGAAGLVLDGNVFLDTSSILNFLCCVTTSATDNAADGLAFNNNYVYSLAATDGAVVSILANCLRLEICDNVVDKAATNDAGHLLTLSSKIVGGVRILRNCLTVVGSSGAAVGIMFTGSGTTSSGICADNYVSSLDTTAALLATAGTKITFIQNFLTGAADASGTVYPAADNPA